MKSFKEIYNILTTYKDILRRKYKVKEMGVFGSFVRGEERKTSDADILVDYEEVPDLLKFLELERYLEELLGIKVDLVRKQAIRKELKDRISREAVIV